MKVRDYRGRVYSLRETIMGEIMHSDHGEGQLEALNSSVNRLADYVATLIEILAEQRIIDEATVLKMTGYGASIVDELNQEKDNTDAE